MKVFVKVFVKVFFVCVGFFECVKVFVCVGFFRVLVIFVHGFLCVYVLVMCPFCVFVTLVHGFHVMVHVFFVYLHGGTCAFCVLVVYALFSIEYSRVDGSFECSLTLFFLCVADYICFSIHLLLVHISWYTFCAFFHFFSFFLNFI